MEGMLALQAYIIENGSWVIYWSLREGCRKTWERFMEEQEVGEDARLARMKKVMEAIVKERCGKLS